MLDGPRPRVLTVLAATPQEEKNALLVNLSASLAQRGSDVILLDTNLSADGVAAVMGRASDATLIEVARQERALDEAVRRTTQGFGIGRLTRGPIRMTTLNTAYARGVSNAFALLARQNDMVVVDGELDVNDDFPIGAMASGEILIQVSGSSGSIKEGYALIKRLNSRLGKRPFSLVVTGAPEQEAKLIFQNMAQAASRYLAVPLASAGWVPPDEHVRRAAKLGRPVIDAFPMAGASIAFRQLAGKFASPVHFQAGAPG
ncbi:MAG: putative Antiactivator of flagellar biosynthesis FleN [Paucimonas sp.]|nr:putative Antiactivator of flagellar biosynthesis FleN [Paucimonas sp.]